MARIAMLLTNPFTHDARVLREAQTLSAAGHEVTVHCVAGVGLPEAETRDGVWVVRHAEPGWLSFTGAARLVPLLRWYGRYEFLAQAAERGGPDVVHGHDLDTLLPASRLARRLGVLHVHDDHELGLEKLGQGVADWLTGAKRFAADRLTGYLKWRGRRLERRILPRAAAVIAVSDLCGQVLRERYGVAPVILRNTPVRSDAAATPLLRQSANLPTEARIALYQGRVTPAGGAEECIDAAAEFPDGWALVFLGVTWMRERLERLAEERGVSGRVRFLDAVEPSDLPAWTRAADIGLAPIRPTNKGQEYSLANKLFEYLHAGLPIVASNIPEQAALVRDLDAGEVIDAVTAPAIAAAVTRIATRPEEERRVWGARLRSAARERYCWEVESEKLRALYERILD